eukprot:TRINITY_DN89323_c0_g1_i1.p1 TRINITY_DN89323_c0_g1~~TRINITY_DN89323_c0_g1_i1.p1  ORF type:complete len:405 (+),score=57.35 TRINITY_DN89323_c0_g1_i1:86-1300(+)
MCDSTMKQMCTGAWTPWGGGPSTTTCSRCEYRFCDYHKEINNQGAQGGHQCVCSEGKKNAAFGALCSGSGSFEQCPHCRQKCCNYHAPSNDSGVQGGHSGCRGPKCATTWGSCGGFVNHKCGYCEEWYCSSHKDSGGRVHGGGHACSIGCDTSVHTQGNCTGTKRQVMQCKLCLKVGNEYKYCPYHFMPVASLLSLGTDQGDGGHVCKGYTGGSMLLGDSMADYFDLAIQAGTTIATAGTMNPLAATMAANACVVACYEMLDALGFEKIYKLSQKAVKLVQKIKQYKDNKSKKDTTKDKDELELQKDLIELLQAITEALGQVPAFVGQIKAFQASVQSGKTPVEESLRILEKFLALWHASNSLKEALPELSKVTKQKPIPKPMDVVKAITKCKAVADDLRAAMK